MAAGEQDLPLYGDTKAVHCLIAITVKLSRVAGYGMEWENGVYGVGERCVRSLKEARCKFLFIMQITADLQERESQNACWF